jgi:putative metallohydrolase (TIGR04338 family)
MIAGPKLLADLFTLGGSGAVRFRQRKTVKLAGREKDMQRKKVYASDDATKPFDTADVSSVADIERYVKRVWASKRMQEACPKMGMHPPQVLDGRGRRRAGGSSQMITMPKWSRREGIVLHELAHTITHRQWGYKVAGHGWQYCEIYLKLVLYMMGRPAHDALKAAFKTNRVRFTAPRAKKPMDPAKKAELVARLDAARRARQAGTVGGPTL